MAHFVGTTGDDTFTGTTGRDRFDMSQGGNDTVLGQGGKDQIYFGAAFTADDHIDGGASIHHHKVKIQATVELNGDYSAGVVFGAQTMVNVATLVLDGGHSYNFTTNETTVGDNQVLKVDASTLGAADSLIFDNSADTDGAVRIVSNAGHVELKGGFGNDTFILADTFNMSDHIDGGGGFNILALRGGYDFTLDAGGPLVNITELQLGEGDYHITLADGLLTTDGMTIVGGALVTGTIDASAETTVGFLVQKINGTVLGGHGDDRIELVNGTANGGDGNDTLNIVNGTAIGGDGNDSFFACTGTIDGGAGNDNYHVVNGTINAGTGDDTFDRCDGIFNLQDSGNVKILNDEHSTGDIFNFGASLTISDVVDGGDGFDTVVLDGDYASTVLRLDTWMRNIETLQLTGGNDYAITVRQDFLSKNFHFAVDGSDLGASDTLTFNASNEFKGYFTVLGGAGDDTIVGGGHGNTMDGGAGRDTISGTSGADKVTGGMGADHLDGGGFGLDIFIYNSAQESSSLDFDTIQGFAVSRDTFIVPVAVTAIDAAVSGGLLDDTGGAVTFDNELASAMNGHLGADHAVLFTPDSGSLAGDVFLVVDQNGIAGYQSGEDLVIRLDGATDLNVLNAGNFQTA